MALQDYDMDDVEKEMSLEGGKAPTDFDCPGCNANNPADPPLSDGCEVLCHYCGSEFKVLMSEGRVKFKEV
jgi:transcription elongation factor Elf1